MYVTVEKFDKAIRLLKKAKSYIKKANFEAETKHDSYGEYYMDGVQYDIMQETEKLLAEINSILREISKKDEIQR